MKLCFLCSILFFLSCPGLIQAPSAKPGSNIPIGTGSQTPNNNLLPENPIEKYISHCEKISQTPNNNLLPGNLSNKLKGQQNQNTAITLPSNRQWGLVRCDGKSLKTEAFNSNVKNFLSTSNDPGRMAWWVKCNFNDSKFKNWKGGVFIRGQVFVQSNKSNPESQQLIPTEKSSYIEIHILDHIEGIVINPIRMQIVKLSSSISKNTVTLVFKDDKGEVTLKGIVNKNSKINAFTISGNMFYLNYVDHAGTKTNYSGFLGYFEIPVYSFLSCDNRLTAPPQGL